MGILDPPSKAVCGVASQELNTNDAFYKSWWAEFGILLLFLWIFCHSWCVVCMVWVITKNGKFMLQ